MGDLLSIGGVAEEVKRSPALLRQLEREGILPTPLRLVGSDRRVYRSEDLPRIRQILEERTARQRGGHNPPGDGGQDGAA